MKQLTFAVSILAASTANAGVVLHVDDDAAPGGNGLNWASAYQDLQDALDDAAALFSGVAEIRVGQGTYSPTVELIAGDPRSASFQLLNGIAIRGGYAGTGAPDPDDRDIALYETTLSGDIGVPDDNSDNIYRTLWCLPEIDSTAVLDGFTVTRGYANGPGNVNFHFAAGLRNEGSPTISNCTFSDNVSSGVCGGVYNDGGSPTFVTCRFERNFGERGGAVINALSDAAFIDCHFQDNMAVFDGGAVRNYGGAPSYEGCTFVDNLVEGGSPEAEGGAVSNYETTTALYSDCVFTGNAAKLGGAVHNQESTPTFVGCMFIGNSALPGGGGGMSNQTGGNPTLVDCLFFGNDAGPFGGGGVRTVGGTASFTDCVFECNSTTDDGGGMHVNHSSLQTLVRCLFRNNTAADVGESNGGGLYDGGNARVMAVDCAFEGNHADNAGGGSLHVHDDSEIVGCDYLGNTAGGDGGGIYNAGQSLFEDCTVVNNEAIRGGGAFFSDDDPTIRRCLFQDNTAFGDGGGLHTWDETTVSVEECVFLGNTAAGFGGAVRNGDNAEPLYSNCIFSGNEADNGAGMANLGSSEPTVTGCSFSHNNASMFAGGIYTSGPAMTLNNSVLWGNTDVTGFTEIAQVFTGASGIFMDYSCVEGLTGFLGGAGNTGADPMFVDPLGTDGTPGTEDDDLRLDPSSPLIDAGDNGAVPVGTTTDLDGIPRFLEIPETPDTGIGDVPIVDMGAYESLGGGCLAITGQEIVCHANGTTFTMNIEGINACTGGTTQVTFTASGGAVGEELCFTALVNDGGFCCSTEICVTIPDCTPAALPSDLDGDGIVGMVDFLALLSAWGSCSECGNCPADFDGDCSVGILDLLILLENWG